MEYKSIKGYKMKRKCSASRMIISAVMSVVLCLLNVSIHISKVDAASIPKNRVGCYYQVDGTNMIDITEIGSKTIYYTLYDNAVGNDSYVYKYYPMKVVSKNKAKDKDSNVKFKWKSKKKLKVYGSDTDKMGFSDIGGVYIKAD